MNVIVDGGAVPALMTHLQAPPSPHSDGDMAQKPFEHEVEKGSAFALGLLAIKVLNLILMCLYSVLAFHAPSIVICDLVVGIDCFYSQSIRS